MRIKPPGLFYVGLAILLSVLVLVSYPVPVSAIPILPVVIIISAFLGGVAGWFLHDYFNKQPSVTGITYYDYMVNLFNFWKNEHQTRLNTAEYLSDLVSKYKLYIIRKAEYNALNYLDRSVLPLEVMSFDENGNDPMGVLCKIQRAIHDLLAESVALADYTADTAVNKNYGKIQVWWTSYNQYTTNTGPLDLGETNIGDVGVYYVVRGNAEITLYDCNTSRFETYTFTGYHEYIPSRDKILINPTVENARVKFSNVACGGTYPYCYASGLVVSAKKQDGQWYTVGSQDFITTTYLNALNRIRNLFWEGYNYAQAYHQILRSRGYTSKSDVPPIFICPPVDAIAGYDQEDLNEIADKVKDPAELAKIYLWFAETAARYFNRAVGCLSDKPVNVTYVKTTVVGGTTATITTVIGGTTQTYTTTYVTTITTEINGTTTTLVSTVTSTGQTVVGGTTTVLTTVLSGTQVITTTYTVVNPGEAPDMYLELRNVTIVLPSGTTYYGGRMWIIDFLQGSLTFCKGTPTVTQNLVRAMIEFTNGTRWFGDLPNATSITPGLIVTRDPTTGKETYHDCYTLTKKPLSQWVSAGFPDLVNPELIKPLSNMITLMLTMVMILMPIMIIAMLMNMIGSMVRGRMTDMRGARHAEDKASGTLQA